MEEFTSQSALDCLNDYAAAWRGNDVDDIAAHWDDGGFVFYKAEEITEFMHDWDRVLAYWRQNEKLHDAISLQFSNARCTPISADTVVVTVDMRWDIRFADDATHADGPAFPHRGKTMGGNNHVVVFFGQRKGQWRIRGWSETPDAAITYMRSLYFRNANPGALDDHD